MILSFEETLLIDAIEDVAFGRLMDVYVPQREANKDREVRGNNTRLIELLRSEGVTNLLTVTIHERQAQQIEIAGEINGFKFVKKIKL